MKSIIKSQIYQMKSPYIWKKVLILLLAFLILMIYIDVVSGDTSASVSRMIADGYYEGLVIFILLFVALTTAEICGNDLADKSVNYELLSGHSRKEVYFARAIVALAVSITGACILTFIPFFIFKIAGLWGDTLDFGEIMIRSAISLLPFTRVCFEVIFLTYIVKNGFLSSLLSCVAIVVIVLVNGMGYIRVPYLLSVSNVMGLYRFRSNSVLRLKDMKEFIVFDSAVEGSVALATFSYSVLLGLVVLWLGYKVFEKDDL